MSGRSDSGPDVTVITPTKNRLPLLRDTLDSVAAQTFANWEHIVVDDGSNDGTDEVMAAKSARDPRVRYIKRCSETSGANACRNQAINEARASLIVFLDSDDLLRRDCLELRVRIMQRNLELDFAVFRGSAFETTPDKSKRIYHQHPPGDDLLRFLTHECIWEITSPIWRREFLMRIGCFDEELLSMQDLEMHVRAISFRGRYLSFPNVDHDIRWQPDSTKTSVRHFKDLEYIAGAEMIRTKLLAAVKNGGLLTWSRRRAITAFCFNSAELWARHGRLSKALQVWHRGCVEPRAGLVLVSGYLMLIAASLGPGQAGLPARVINKWKGWVRFRPEPSLLTTADEPDRLRP
ncbi:MAG: hypothetical protein DMF90_14630 [Acidobacteria bacterium]|nr:MAG: hypothetical protein DMF90_14630 [Acidobacteriota bacterium]